MVKINNKELDFDVFDLDSSKRFEKGLIEIAEKADRLDSENVSFYDGSLALFQVITKFFDSVVYDGASNTIFGKETNLKTAIKAFREFTDYVNEEKRQLNNELSLITKNMK